MWTSATWRRCRSSPRCRSTAPESSSGRAATRRFGRSRSSPFARPYSGCTTLPDPHRSGSRVSAPPRRASSEFVFDVATSLAGVGRSVLVVDGQLLGPDGVPHQGHGWFDARGSGGAGARMMRLCPADRRRTRRVRRVGARTWACSPAIRVPSMRSTSSPASPSGCSPTRRSSVTTSSWWSGRRHSRRSPTSWRAGLVVRRRLDGRQDTSATHRSARQAVRRKPQPSHRRQVQIFTPTPSTYSTLMYYTEKDWQTEQSIFVEKKPEKKLRHRTYSYR